LEHLLNNRRLTLVPAAIALGGAILGALVGTAAHARGGDVQLIVTLPVPVITLPAPRVYLPAPVLVQPVQRSEPPAAVVVYEPVYRHPGFSGLTRWDVDGDGIPNRYDRVYNPPWDRNGNGVPDRREYGHHRHGPWGDRDRDGIPNRYDRRDDRWDRGHDRRYDGPHDGRQAPYEPRGPR
jgi:hypothetical protein